MQTYKSKVDIIYENLIEGIGKGIYAPGQRLVISQLAKENDSSEIPVREAIRRLESGGYVDILANKGPYVREFSPEKAMTLFQIKGVLEGYATRLSIDYLTEEDFAHLRQLNDRARACEEAGAAREYSQLNESFHLYIYQQLPQKELYDMICELWKKWGITRSVFSMAPSIIPGSIQDHERIVQLIEQKDYDGVERFVRAHKEKAGAAMSQRLRGTTK